MKSREDTIRALLDLPNNCNNSATVTNVTLLLMAEILLDIRDLLNSINSK